MIRRIRELFCDLNIYEQNEKSSKYFFNLEKKMGENSIIKKLVKNDIEISNNKDILKELHEFYSSLFERKISKSKNDCNEFLNTLFNCLSSVSSTRMTAIKP